MRDIRTLPTLTLVCVLAAFAGCGDDDDPGTAPPVPEPLAYFEFDAGAGSRVVADSAFVSFHVGPDGAEFTLLSVDVTAADAGRTIPIGADDHPDFAQAVVLLTNGVNDNVDFRRGPVGGGTAITGSDEQTAFTGGALADREPDFAGAEITGILLELETVTIASPGVDPNDDGLWTDVSVRGRIVVLGHP